MPEATQYQFNQQQLLAALLRDAGVTSGHWILAFNIGFAPIENAPLDQVFVFGTKVERRVAPADPRASAK
jgi:hypothetical protein